MSKTKSVIMTTLLTVVIVVLSLMCVVPEFTIPFRVNGLWTKYNSVVSVINYGSDLGGGYSAVYYPEGIVSAQDYNTQAKYYETNAIDELKAAGATGDTVQALKATYTAGSSRDADTALKNYEDYVGKYVAYTTANFGEDVIKGVTDAAIYLEKNEVCFAEDDAFVLNEEFVEEFGKAVQIMAKRFDKKNFSFLQVSKKDDFTVQVKVPYTATDVDTLFEQMGYTGNISLRASADVSNTPWWGGIGNEDITKYVKNVASSTTLGAGVVQVDFTKLGREDFYNITNTMKDNETDPKVYFYVGENEVIALDLSTQKEGFDGDTVYIPVSETLTVDGAENLTIVMDSCIEQGAIDLKFTVSQTVDYTVGSGAGAMMAIYIIFALLVLGSIAFFIVRYKGLGLAHAYALLSFLICMIMFVAFLPGMLLNASSVFAVAITAILLSLVNAYIFENIRKGFNTGKTLTSAIKAGYKSSLAPVLDTHILLFAIAFVLYFISIGEMAVFSFVFLLGALTSGIATLLLTRYYAYITRGLVVRSQQPNFYGFKREVSDDDQD
ncbi:MAG: hypothetical protein IKC91_02590 [Clostridia bacterium]|nr:hypothetical protein [Clostridia bacterium]